MIVPEKQPTSDTKPSEFKRIGIPLIHKIYPSLSGPVIQSIPIGDEVRLKIDSDKISSIDSDKISKLPKYRSLDDISTFET